ncbi:hypothetical protein EDEG_00086 [Edhazardia aedis USNM 41457]|uniref:Uncharacterized protein n=1 Tax=Edhazardia aedis (strain USNM 41457) TaxID=1003232 RepID=J9DBV0_EDHAE|nr:hypothetical protein EDEG_00086 [Edhazardia aedis USNM 41457]|eukprot:EJW04969.1 hypothetical protein EDEG_00086 [Edhazardia aedis USNM 41457]
MDQKLEYLKSLLAQSKQKIRQISLCKNNLKILNYKIEALESIFSNFSVKKMLDFKDYLETTTDIADIDNASDKKDSSQLEEKLPIIEEVILKDDNNEGQPNICVDRIDFIYKTISEFAKNSIYKSNAKKIISALSEEEDNGLTIDELVKRCGITRYKCSEILNDLSRTDPQIIIRKYQKTFYFMLNKF